MNETGFLVRVVDGSEGPKSKNNGSIDGISWHLSKQFLRFYTVEGNDLEFFFKVYYFGETSYLSDISTYSGISLGTRV